MHEDEFAAFASLLCAACRLTLGETAVTKNAALTVSVENRITGRRLIATLKSLPQLGRWTDGLWVEIRTLPGIRARTPSERIWGHAYAFPIHPDLVQHLVSRLAVGD